VIDETGKVIASGSEEHEPFASPCPGWAEQDPRDWWRACGSAVRKALHSSKLRADEIACVGFSGQMHGAVLLDSLDEVVRSAIIWCDQRSEAQSNELEELFGRDALIRLTCNPPLTNFTLTKLLWVRETEPKNWARVAHVMLPKDYVRFRLTGERAIDVADASDAGRERLISCCCVNDYDRSSLVAQRNPYGQEYSTPMSFAQDMSGRDCRVMGPLFER
jgi:xylulokinase